MKTIIQLEILLGLALLAIFAIPSWGGNYANMDTLVQLMLAKQVPPVPAMAFHYSIFRTAPLEVAKVFGRTPGCADADADLIQATANAAIEAGLDPAIAAATVGVESGCNQFAVSTRGAIGLMQVVPRVWKDKFDFAGTVNLLNREDGLRVGTQIEAGLITEFGIEGGLRHYNGMGTLSADYDAGYTNKILALAGRK